MNSLTFILALCIWLFTAAPHKSEAIKAAFALPPRGEGRGSLRSFGLSSDSEALQNTRTTTTTWSHNHGKLVVPFSWNLTPVLGDPQRPSSAARLEAKRPAVVPPDGPRQDALM